MPKRHQSITHQNKLALGLSLIDASFNADFKKIKNYTVPIAIR